MCRLPTFAVLAVTALLYLPAHSQDFPDTDLGDTMPTMNTTIGGRTTIFSIRGVVVKSGDNVPLTEVRVDLRTVGGQLVGSTSTNAKGTFGFDSVRRGEYILEIREIGYQTYTEHLDIENAPAFGIRAVLRRIAADETSRPALQHTVSTRELTIPNKALEAMVKGRQLLYMKSDYPGSIREFQRAIQIFPNYYEAYAEIGIARLEMNDRPQAEEAFRKSLELSNQKYAEAFVLLANLLSDGQRFADAEAIARKAVELDADSWQAHAQLGRALFGLDRASEAENNALAAVKLEPARAELYLLLINVHTKLLNYAGALTDIDAYLKLAPDGPLAERVRAMREAVEHNLANQRISQQPQAPPPEPPLLRPPRE